MQERDAAVAQVVWREHRDARALAGPRQRRAEAVGAEAAEHRPLGHAIVTRHERQQIIVQSADAEGNVRPPVLTGYIQAGSAAKDILERLRRG